MRVGGAQRVNRSEAAAQQTGEDEVTWRNEPAPRAAGARNGPPPPPPPPESASSVRRHLRRLEQQQKQQSEGAGTPRWVTAGLPVAAILITLASVYWNLSLRDQIIWQESSITKLAQQNQKLTEDLRATSTELKAAGDVPSAHAGVPERELDQRAKDLLQEQQEAEQVAAATALAKNLGKPTTGGTPDPAAAGAVPANAGTTAAPAVAPPAVQPAPQHSYLHFFDPAPAKPTETAAPAQQHSYLHFFSNSTPASAPAAEQPAPALPKMIAGTRAEPDITAPRVGTVHAPPRPVTEAAVPPTPPAAHVEPLPVFAPHAGYADPMDENIAEVASLQKSSGRRLEEFHVHEGKVTMPLPDLGLQVKRPDAKHGTYTLVVVEGTTHTEHRGRINQPLLVTERPNGQQYQLVVLNIRNDQIYGYLAGIH